MATRPSKTLEQLEGDIWPDSDPTTDLIATSQRLRKVPVGKLTTENLRMLIAQGIGLVHLLPLALDQLEENPWVAGDYYEGDLLKSVVSIDPAFWAEHADLRGRLDMLVSQVHDQIDLFNKEIFPTYQKIYGGG